MDFNLGADNYLKGTITFSRSRYNDTKNRDFDLGTIVPISEPILGKNMNINNSFSPKVAFYEDKIYAIWVDNSNFSNAGIDYDIFYRHFDGNCWSDIQVISEPIKGQNINTKTCETPDIPSEALKNKKIYKIIILSDILFILMSHNHEFTNAQIEYLQFQKGYRNN